MVFQSSVDRSTLNVKLIFAAKPYMVHFMNSSHQTEEEMEGETITTLHFDEGKTYDIGCMAMGGVPNPRIEVTVGEDNYTRAFQQHESQVC